MRGPPCWSARWSTQSTAGHAEEVSAPVRITHPFHPQCGQVLELVERRHNWGEDRVFYRDHHGHLASLPARWTSVAAEDAFVVAAAGRSRLRLADLVVLAALVQELRG